MRLRTLPLLSTLRGQRLLLRLDLNVPCKGLHVKDDYKIISALPTIKKLRSLPLIIMSHRGEPITNGKRYNFNNAYSLAPVVQRLKKYAGGRVFLATGSWTEIQKQAAALKPGEIMVLENLRFWSGEIKNNIAFARDLASLATVYVNDAFAVSHRRHASIVAITRFLPSYAGPLLEAEINHLSKVGKSRSMVVVFGGAKISDKLPLIKKFLPRAKAILVGGGIANALLKARGYEVGTSFYEIKSLAAAKRLLSPKIIIPEDVIVQRGRQVRTVLVKEVQKNEAIFDIGPRTSQLYSNYLRSAKTIVWNGPLGLFESPAFTEGTKVVAIAISQATKKGAFSIVGGGETVEAVRKIKLTHPLSWISTGGGATLHFLSGKTLPGLNVLRRS